MHLRARVLEPNLPPLFAGAARSSSFPIADWRVKTLFEPRMHACGKKELLRTGKKVGEEKSPLNMQRTIAHVRAQEEKKLCANWR